jgi:hypothetical protein
MKMGQSQNPKHTNITYSIVNAFRYSLVLGGLYSKVNNVFCLSLLGLLDSSYGSIPARARSDRNVLGGSHGLPPHSSMYRYTNSGRSSLRPFYSSFSINDLKSLIHTRVGGVPYAAVALSAGSVGRSHMRPLRWHDSTYRYRVLLVGP